MFELPARLIYWRIYASFGLNEFMQWAMNNIADNLQYHTYFVKNTFVISFKLQWIKSLSIHGMAQHKKGAKSLLEPMISLFTNIYVSQHQFV